MSKLDWHARRTQIELTALVELRDGVVSSRDLRQTRNVEEGLDRVSETKRARDMRTVRVMGGSLASNGGGMP